jgi:heterodisulfide reductase subunit A
MAIQPDGKEIAQINKALCKGCGTCAVWCPTNSITARHFTDNQIVAMITALFEDYHV